MSLEETRYLNYTFKKDAYHIIDFAKNISEDQMNYK